MHWITATVVRIVRNRINMLPTQTSIAYRRHIFEFSNHRLRSLTLNAFLREAEGTSYASRYCRKFRIFIRNSIKNCTSSEIGVSSWPRQTCLKRIHEMKDYRIAMTGQTMLALVLSYRLFTRMFCGNARIFTKCWQRLLPTTRDCIALRRLEPLPLPQLPHT